VSFNNIIGNSRVKNILKKGLKKERIPNSLLFSGPDGVGKKKTALVLAKAMNCLSMSDDSCEECANCRAINNNNFPDVLILAPKKDVIKIDEIRMLKQIAYLRPMVGKRRVFIVQEAEKMTEPASNSFLKILEEPPLFSHIFLTSRNPYLILSTLRSRCQILTFSQISRKDIQEELINNGYDEYKAGLISLLVKGNLEQAVKLKWEDVQPKRQRAWELFQALTGGKNAAGMFKNLFSSGKEFRKELEQILEILITLMRDLLLIKSSRGQGLLLNPDYADKIGETAGVLSVEKSMAYLKLLESIHYSLQKRVNVNLLVSSLFSEIIPG
jgi:DNA polymerase III delta' subunit